MDYQLDWFIKGRVLSVIFKSVISFALAHQCVDVVMQLMNTEGDLPSVHILVDTRGHTEIETDLIRLQSLTQIVLPYKQHKLSGWIVVIQDDPNPTMAFVAMTAMQTIDQKIHLVADMPQAIAFLQAMDDTLGNHNLPKADADDV